MANLDINEIWSKEAVEQMALIDKGLLSNIKNIEKLVAATKQIQVGGVATEGKGSTNKTASTVQAVKANEDLTKVYQKVIQLEAEMKVLQAGMTGEINKAVAASVKQTNETNKLKTAKEKKKKATIEEKLAEQEANQIKKITAQLNKAEEGSFNQLSAQYRLNVIELNKMTAAERDNTARGKELTAGTKDLRDKMISLKSDVSDHTLKVGRYTDALGTVSPAMGRAANGAAAFGKSLWALVANPVGAVILAVVGAVALLGKAFMSTDSGANMFKGIMGALKNIFDVVIDRVVSFSKLISAIVRLDWDGIKENAKDTFTGVGKAIADAAKEGYMFVQQMDRIADRESAAAIRTSRLKKEIAELRNITKDQTKADSVRLRASESALAKEKELSSIQKKFAKERLDASIAELAGKTGVKKDQLNKWLTIDDRELESTQRNNKEFAKWVDKNEEDFQALQKQKSELIDMDTEYLDGIRRMASENSRFRKELNDAAAERRKQQSEERAANLKGVSVTLKLSGAWEDYYEALKKAEEDRKKGIDENNDAHVKSVKDKLDVIKDLNKDYYDYVFTKEEEYSNKIKDEQKSKRYEYIKQGFEAIVGITDLYTDILSEKLSDQTEKNNEEQNIRLENLKASNEQGLISDDEYLTRKTQIDAEYQAKQDEIDKKERDGQKLNIIANQAAAIADIWIKYSQTVASYELAKAQALALGPIIGAPLAASYAVLQGKALISAIAGTTLAAAQVIPAFEKGGIMPHDGKALVGEKRREVIELPNGTAYITPNEPTIIDLPKGAKIHPDAARLNNEAITNMVMLNSGMNFNTKTLETKLDTIAAEVRKLKEQPQKKLSLMDEARIARKFKRLN